MSNAPTKVFIKVESQAEQKENIKNCRKTFKVLQKSAITDSLINKENVDNPLKPRTSKFSKSKSADLAAPLPNFHNLIKKRKNVDLCDQHTQTEAYETEKNTSKNSTNITAEDLTSTEKPSERYFELLAEKRREALESTLTENQTLHERIEGLEAELDTSKKMLDEARSLVEVLTEMLEEKEIEETLNSTAADNDDAVNYGASSSSDTSRYFDLIESPVKVDRLQQAKESNIEDN